MAKAGRGLLMVAADVPAEHEAEVNDWYDREHLEERVAIAGFLSARRLRCLADLAVPDASSAYQDSLHPAADSGAYFLEIRMPPPLGLVVGVADVVPDRRSLTAEVTMLHLATCLSVASGPRKPRLSPPEKGENARDGLEPSEPERTP